MKSENLEIAIEELDAAIRHGEQQITEKKQAVNTLCELIGQPVRFALLNGERTVAPFIPTLADRERPDGTLPGEVKIKHREPRSEPAVVVKKKKAATAPPARVDGRKTELRAKVLSYLQAAKVPVDLYQLAEGVSAERTAVDYHVQSLLTAKQIHCTRKGRPGLRGQFWHSPEPPAPKLEKGQGSTFLFGNRAEGKPAKVEKPKAVAKAAPVAVARHTARLALLPGETTDVAVRRVVAGLGATFTRVEIDEFCPSVFTGVAIGEAVKRLREAGVLKFCDYQPSGQPATYERGPNWGNTP
jgi:hypothetical protein